MLVPVVQFVGGVALVLVGFIGVGLLFRPHPTENLERSPHKTRLLRGTLGAIAILVLAPLAIFAAFWLWALPETATSDSAMRLGVMPQDAHVLYSDFEFEDGRPIVSAEWHTCSSSPFRVGSFRVDLLSQKVLESDSEDWETGGELPE